MTEIPFYRQIFCTSISVTSIWKLIIVFEISSTFLPLTGRLVFLRHVSLSLNKWNYAIPTHNVSRHCLASNNRNSAWLQVFQLLYAPTVTTHGGSDEEMLAWESRWKTYWKSCPWCHARSQLYVSAEMYGSYQRSWWCFIHKLYRSGRTTWYVQVVSFFSDVRHVWRKLHCTRLTYWQHNREIPIA